MRGQTKISSSHRSRRALIYVRQSTMAQVRNNTESTARQYGLADMAASLGWATADIEVVDADLGLSGRSAEGRAGFKEVVGRVCLGEVGAIFGLEVSRLARSSADLSKLLELARLTDTLVVDADGVYDLSDINDRLLLGLKNQMSEAELHILASRMDKAKRAAAARGGRDIVQAPPGGRRPGASGNGRPPPGSSATTRAPSRSTPTRRCKPPCTTCSPRSRRPGRRTGWSVSSTGAASPAATSTVS
jgi:DNA invertase Pin-like site-specific DNA recombinase